MGLRNFKDFIQLLLWFFFAQFYILIKSEHFSPFKRTALKTQHRHLEFIRNRLIALNSMSQMRSLLLTESRTIGPDFGHKRLCRFGVEPRIYISKFTNDADAPGLKTVISIGPVYPINISCGVGRRNYLEPRTGSFKQDDLHTQRFAEQHGGVQDWFEGSRQPLKVELASHTPVQWLVQLCFWVCLLLCQF